MDGLLQHHGDGPRADGQARPRAASGAAPRRIGARVRALAGLQGHLPFRRLSTGQASPGKLPFVFVPSTLNGFINLAFLSAL